MLNVTVKTGIYFFRLATVKPRANSLGTCTQNTHELQVHERRAITLYPGAQQPLASVCTSHRSTTHTHNPRCAAPSILPAVIHTNAHTTTTARRYHYTASLLRLFFSSSFFLLPFSHAPLFRSPGPLWSPAVM